jgi:hypothetical protein
VEQISKDLLKSPPPGIDTAALDRALTGSRAAIARMAALITAKNAPDFERELDSLHADEKVLKTFSSTVESMQ